MQNKRGDIDWDKLTILVFLILGILALFLIVHNYYKEQKKDGKQECENRGFIYDKTKTSFIKEDKIICLDNRTESQIILTYLNGEWKVTKW